MKFEFRQLVQSYAVLPQNRAVGFRSGSLHAASISEAAERFIPDDPHRPANKTRDPSTATNPTPQK